jgi:hypothetical protein
VMSFKLLVLGEVMKGRFREILNDTRGFRV